MQGWTRRTQGARRAAREALGRLVRGDAERGDVPGWVLITLMTAGLVIALWAVAGPALTQAFSNAISSVGAP
ncbi:hypothetical protein [Cellulosimicrobium cellulans]|uniref:Uncharacterized protein n=1 Tax=Cellulosimicrobium cellulans TaxID=1710 RepID=A0A4Y4E0R3_CELCE|nr:hypothetical protein [Cellulosimicrobium cellulans]MDF9875708.1 hypothetical protein [Cellulosimicrobium cellulans]GED09178.1 hypothetical protein CCE02nite_11770 [Cellulosimicrobium cellulans]